MTDSTRDPRSIDEVRETLDAIASGSVDAIVVEDATGPQVYRLEAPDRPFRTFVECMQEGALTLSADGTIFYANGYFAQLVDRPPEALVGMPLADLVAPSFHFTLATLIREGIERPVKGRCLLELPNGGIPVQFTLSPLATGSRPTCCAVVFDLRERELADEAHAARMAAERANTAKDQFLAMLSHELRSPLNTMLGWAQILAADQGLTPTAQRAAQTIERNARTQAQLIGDLLDISRISAGKLSLEMSNLEFGALVDSVVSGMRPLAERKRISLVDRLEDCDVYGDPTRLQQVVTNLLNNALKFTLPGGTIEVVLESGAETVTLTLRDTGIGMSRELLAHAFDVFHQGGSLERRQGGLGLGLPIAKQLAEAHRGTLTAASEGEGCGSTFVVRLPRASKGVAAPRHDFRVHGELSGIFALVVDDEQDNLDITRYLLEAAGCTVTTAASASHALASLAQGDYGLLVSDIGLPDQDGLELMREIRARGFGPERLPAIALTGYAGMHDARLVTAAGYQRHLPKPVDAATLVRTASEVCRRDAPAEVLEERAG